MKLPFELVMRDIPHSDAIEAHIHKKAEKLDVFYDKIMRCRVVVEAPHRHQHHGKLFNVRIDVTVPGAELVVNRDKDEDVYVAIRDSFNAMVRKLEDYGRRQRGEIKAHDMALHGHIAKLFKDEGYGFITMEDGRELYFHQANLANEDFDRLDIGEDVHFIETMGSEGPQANRVSVRK
ncbi:HPF/RaiA family ribosome-associated protein [Sulfurirhabdus autotrophica]|uniref:Ribosomal subunit interface protein n=1 Tax=Sulfurirhabdus autotrophica TaxID=1706046 RepID=A0A4R3Y0J1_9PROT|nr:HPF/RaiA family ribosome-associated protein [Sulfurirhabdus autotrophica]TCV85140.1 ribosomal subunit interface protein [Sulfurirhabdus autotrophica]